jgi:ribulose-5-phosphate 4-epimerase/fuculose-1-phosphate aldolase
MTIDTSEIRGRVARACRVLGRLDLTKAATGHVSARVPGADRFVIRARGPAEIGVRYTEAEQIIEIDGDGRSLIDHSSGLAVPLEVYIHTEIYRSRSDVQAVVHMHPPIVVLFTICNEPLLPLYGAYDAPGAKLAIEGVPRYERSILIDGPDLGRDLAATLGQSSACLMHGHGITTVGPNVEEAALTAIHLNELALINFQARQLGTPRAISVEDQAAALKLAGSPSPDGQGEPAGGRSAALWRYYCSLTESS